MVFKSRNNSRSAKELKSQLETIAYRLHLASDEKSASVDQNTYFVTNLLREDPSKKEIATIRAEGMIRDEKATNAYNIMEAICELLKENNELIEHSKSCPPDLVSSISTLLYAAEQLDILDIDEMAKLRKYFKKKYGSGFVKSAKNNMNQRIVSKLSIELPAANEVHAYLTNICKQDGLIAEPVTALPVGYVYSKGVSAMQPPPPSNPTFNRSQLREVIGINNSNLLPSVTSAANQNILSHAVETYDETYFKDWLATLKSEIGSVDDGKGSLLIPAIGGTIKEEFDEALKNLWAVYHAKNSARRHAKGVQKNSLSTEEQEDDAWAAVIAAEEALLVAKGSCQELAQPILAEFAAKYDEMENLPTENIEQYETILCQCAAICRAKPRKLAAYCAQGEESKNRLMRLFRDTQLLKHIMLNGDASPEFYEKDRQGLYGEVMEIYEKIMEECPKARMNSQCSDTTNRHLYNRIAIACACEFATPKEHYDRPGLFVDAVGRYRNYERAYDNGLLDPNFDSFTTWELRMIVNSDLLDSELDWIRSMEMNYRPDLTISDDKHWIYTLLVKTDVHYKNPPKREDGAPYDIMQHFSGGGKCGPRARAGRAICKAFGIPTWGAKVPRHTYLTRWTSKTPDMEDTSPASKNHWATNLGAKNPMYFKWGPKQGTDFFIETQLRERYRKQQEVYGRRVCLFEWLQCIEDGYFICGEMPRANEVYYFLAESQKAYLYENEMGDEDYLVLDNKMEEYNPVERTEKNATTTNRFTALKERKNEGKEKMIPLGGGIMIPASAYNNESALKGVSTMKSYLGGNQVLLGGNSTATYKLPAKLTTGRSGDYQLSCIVCTIHADQISNPFALTVSSVDDDATTVVASREIMVPYTIGEWKQTVPIPITLTPGKETLIQFTRSRGRYSVSMKGIFLEEIRADSSPTNGTQIMASRYLHSLSDSLLKDGYMNGQINFGINRGPVFCSIQNSNNPAIYESSVRKEETAKARKGTIMSAFRRRRKGSGPDSTITQSSNNNDKDKKININSDFDFGFSNALDEGDKSFSMNGGLNLGVTIM